jgi:transformation/transcription domain-associated protein
MVVLRHLIATPYRRAFLSQLDKLFNERVLLGTGVGSKETLRFVFSILALYPLHLMIPRSASAYAAVADLVHHLRNDLTPMQLARIAHIYSRLIHNPYLANSLHTLFAKMMFNLIEVVVTKDTPQGTAKVLRAMFETCVDKLDAMTAVQDELAGMMERTKAGDKDLIDLSFIEKARPVACAVYAVDKPEDVIHGEWAFLRVICT